MFGPTPLRDIFLVAGFELRESLRSKRVLFFAVLYLLVACLASNIFVQLLRQTERMTIRAAMSPQRPLLPGLPRTPSPPPSPRDDFSRIPVPEKPSQGLFFGKFSPFRSILDNVFADPVAAEFVADQPAIILWFMVTSIVIMPFMIMLTASESIAQEHQSRGIRFIALRTGRAEFALGKIFGQGLLITFLVMGSACVFMAMGAWKLADFQLNPALLSALLFWPRIVAYCVPFLGLAALCSMSSNSTVSSRVYSLLCVGGTWWVHEFSAAYVGTPYERLFNTLNFFTPQGHWVDLWYPEPAKYGYAMLMLVFLGIFYAAIGLITYRDRDL